MCVKERERHRETRSKRGLLRISPLLLHSARNFARRREPSDLCRQTLPHLQYLPTISRISSSTKAYIVPPDTRNGLASSIPFLVRRPNCPVCWTSRLAHRSDLVSKPKVPILVCPKGNTRSSSLAERSIRYCKLVMAWILEVSTRERERESWTQCIACFRKYT